MTGKRSRCPGHCGKTVRAGRFACSDCWARLPGHLRRAVVATLGKPNSRGKTDAWNTAAAYLGRRDI